MSRRIAKLLSRAEIAELTAASDGRGSLSVAVTWTLIGGAFALAAWRPSWWTGLLAVIVLGGRQLALAVLMHEASHRSLFRTRWLNDVVGHWLCGAPVWSHLKAYRTHHGAHHTHAGTDRDPDLDLITPFPTSRRSLARKFARDLTGLSGLRRVIGLLLMDFGVITYSASGGSRRVDLSGRGALDIVSTGLRNLAPTLLSNAALAAALHALGHGWLYLLWVLAYLTTFSLFLRIRSIAEHACTDLSAEPFLNTRTTRANPLARLTVAPHNVNFHLEHHLLMTVPHYRLPAMHRMLRERGALDDCHLAGGYFEVMRRVVSAR